MFSSLVDEVAETATHVKNNVEIYKYLPEFAEVAGVTVNISQFLLLLNHECMANR
jgi:hypothetical protein